MLKNNKNLKSTVKKTGIAIAVSASVTIATAGIGGMTTFADTLHHVPQNGPVEMLAKPAVNSDYTNINYDYTMAKYAAAEMKEYGAGGGAKTKANLDAILQAINPKYASSAFEFLKVNTFRNVDEAKVAETLSNEGVLAGQAENFINAAREYNLDPVYFISQSQLESGRGTSNFANGITIDKIAVPIMKNGATTGYKLQKLDKPTTVYNLYGIGAYNSLASFPNRTTIMATTYAYNHGWTSVPKAIYGAAKFLSTQYVHNTNIAQITPYELRYINAPAQDMWHQYSTDIQYASKIGSIINENKNLYENNDTFEFGIPKFEEEAVKPAVKPETKPEVKPETKPEVKPETKPEVKPETKPEVKPETKPEVKPETKPEVKPETKPEVKPETKPE
ncbi:MAG: glucosaminidase domain-containing protein, partial [Clostridium sp.]